MAEKAQANANVMMDESTSNGHQSFGFANAAKNLKKRKTSDSDDTDFDNYFVGPRDLDHHSKWPIFLQLHGSITPSMLLPLLFVGGWSAAITLISKMVHNLGINQLLLTVLGFVVGLALSFRSSTAYERYNEGRKYWCQLNLASQNLARLIWIHAQERHNDESDPLLGKKDLLAKISCLNLIVAYSVALKHRLRFEPYAHYEDIHHMVGHLDTCAKAAGLPNPRKRPNIFKTTGTFLGIPMAESNPRKELKKATAPLGNLPLEILNSISAYMKTVFENETLKAPIYQTQAMTTIYTMNDVLTGTDRILNTPLPIAYSIAIAQITWVYILLLPFQLFNSLGYVTIPASIFAAYIILGIALIGREIENPFGDDVNDLPLDAFCVQIRSDVELIMSRPPPSPAAFLNSANNEPLYPLSQMSNEGWMEKSIDEIRAALALKVGMSHQTFMESADLEKVKTKDERRSERRSRDLRRDVEAGHHGE